MITRGRAAFVLEAVLEKQSEIKFHLSTRRKTSLSHQQDDIFYH